MWGGKLSIESEVGTGSTFAFEVTFPRAEASAKDKPVASRPESVPDHCSSRYRVLVAEDNRVNQLLIEKLLVREDHDVTIVSNGREALDALESLRFDVVLMDVQMPEMDGFEAVSRWRERESSGRVRVPVVAMTAHAMSGDRERCLEAGMDAYVSKPIQPAKLFDAIEDAISSARDFGKIPAARVLS
jgi:CheY-like chemotaxis protein